MSSKIDMRYLFPIGLFVILLGFNLTFLSANNRRDLIPSDIPMVVGIDNIHSFTAELKESSVGALFASPQMRSFLNNQSIGDFVFQLMEHNGLLVDEHKKMFLPIIQKYCNLFNGEIVAGFGLAGSGDFLMLARMSSREYKKSLEFDGYFRSILSESKSEKTYRYRDVQIYEWVGEKDHRGINLWKGWIGDTVIIGTRSGWVEECVVQISNKKVIEPANMPFFYFSMGKSFLRKILEGEKSRSHSLYDAMGMEEIDRLKLGCKLDSNQIRFLFDISFGKKDRGIWRLLTQDPLPVYFQLMPVPENIHSYHVARLNIGAFWETLPDMLYEMDPRTAFHFRSMVVHLGESSQTRISKELFDNLDSLVVGYSRVIEGEKKFLYGIPLKSPIVTRMLLDKIFLEGGFLRLVFPDVIDVDHIRGSTLYTIRSASPAASLPIVGSVGSPRQRPNTFALTVSDGSFFFGSHQLIREYLQGVSNHVGNVKFFQTDRFRKAMGCVPDDAISFSIFNTIKWFNQLERVLDGKSRLKSQNIPKRKDPLKMETKPSIFKSFVEQMKSRKLPPAEFISSFFGTSVGFSRLRDRHFLVTYIITFSKNR